MHRVAASRLSRPSRVRKGGLEPLTLLRSPAPQDDTSRASDRMGRDAFPFVNEIGSVLGIVYWQMRAVILIRIPAPGMWMPATIFLTLANRGWHRLLGAGEKGSRHSAVGGA